MTYRTVSCITTDISKTKKYPYAHRKANEAEKERYGTTRFNRLNKIIKKVIPKGEWAGTHDKQGRIKVSRKIPRKYRGEVALHERIERDMMRKR